MKILKAVFSGHGHKHSHSVADMDYFAYNSNLYSVNPFFKTGFFVLALIVSVALKNMRVCIFTFAVMSFITLFIGRIQWHIYRRLLMLPLYFIILSCITMAVGFKGGIHLSKTGLINCVRVFLTAFSGVSCLYALALSTPISDITEVLKKIKIPSIIIELMFLIYRFIFVLAEVAGNMNKSARCRYGYSNFRNSVNTYSLIARNLMIYSLNKTNKFYDAMLARKYNGNIAFYCNYDKINIKYIVYAAIYFVITGGLCFL